MTSRRVVIVAILLVLALTWGMLRLLGSQYAAGNFYPEYSSLRAAPKGTKLLFDSLSRLPELKVKRNYLPLDYVQDRAADVLVLGLRPVTLDKPFLQRVERIARNGNRVIAALVFARDDKLGTQLPLEQVWHVGLTVDPDPKHEHPLSLSAGNEWKARMASGAKVLAVERSFGSGSVLLLAESEIFTNETLIAGRLSEALEAIGSPSAVVFDEQHFGIAESGSIVSLVMRFRLAGLAFGLILLAGLALWRYTAAFPPSAAVADTGHHTGRTSFEGLLALLRRHIPSKDLAQACWEEWLKANRREIAPEAAREAAKIVESAGGDPLQAMRGLQRVLHVKGEF
jgi:hypothetical protein